MARVYLVLALLLAAFWVYSIVDCAVQPPTRHRGVSKPIWLLIVILLPVVGGVLWFVIGRSRASSSRVVFRAPDDDPDFLGRIGTSSDQDDRIRRLEEELAALDSEAPDPRDRPADPPAEDDSDEQSRGSRS
ncbi:MULTISPECIES: PLD nuclease N-terminal domain-containing protein [Microbacterium]|uniref:PLD nuclease N-terminal domain-containing protein n=1 Tax=Microbacterium aquilitoris TaxID=3067307 RepID=A0ABU3GH32_9MICO|nr:MULTISPECIES: PLD nuclease N-terminal domain-containing protein [unclassified Microbacterium]MDT3330013.1 PLD nuclease N-terminal domain-containing protein [Microbacterium sp. KSW-18]MDT3345846.1 PLD nuclease N-terminal domain-containing protein [Microbacterium sp. KSW2-22]SDG88952.1 Phospholipase_D-nuclease N-terminal [Microbacterium sp. 77mftsu3.1]